MVNFDDDKLPPAFEGMDGLAKVRPLRPDTPQTKLQETRALDWPKLAGLEPPPRQWAIKGWLGFGHVTLLVGQGGIGKTLLAQQMASSMALGREFVGEVPRPLKVLMWACEDDHDELWRRQVYLARWCKAGLEEFHENLVIVPRQGLENTLVTTEYGKLLFSPLIGELSQQANDLRADVVVIDNAGQTYGGSENDRHSVTSFLNTLVGALTGKAIMLLAHPSRAAGSEFSGSSAWENVARTRLYLGATLPGEKPDPEANPEDNVRYLSRRKANYSPKDWRRMTYADGALTPDEIETTGGLIQSINASKAERVIVTGLRKLSTMGVHGSSGSRSPNFLPKILTEYKLDEGLPSRELSAAMRQLMLTGRIKQETVGKSQNRNAIKGLVALDD